MPAARRPVWLHALSLSSAGMRRGEATGSWNHVIVETQDEMEGAWVLSPHPESAVQEHCTTKNIAIGLGGSKKYPCIVLSRWDLGSFLTVIVVSPPWHSTSWVYCSLPPSFCCLLHCDRKWPAAPATDLTSLLFKRTAWLQWKNPYFMFQIPLRPPAEAQLVLGADPWTNRYVIAVRIRKGAISRHVVQGPHPKHTRWLLPCG